MKTIIQKDLYIRGKNLFDKSPLELLKFDIFEKEKMIHCQKQSTAKCFIIGAEKYGEDFYNSILPESLVIRFGVGYDSVPVDICKKRGIKVAYTPGTLNESVAEHTIAMLLSAARKIPQADKIFKEDKWIVDMGLELRDKTLAIIGFGKIGMETARIAKQGFKMNINAFDLFPELNKNFSEIVDFYSTNFEEVIKNADFVSLHLSYNKDTENFLNRDKLIVMSNDVIIINTARGKLINETDLYEALLNGEIKGAALDVFNQEPYIPVDNEKDLRKLRNVILTPHISSNTDNANKRMAKKCISNAINYYRKQHEKIIFIPEML